MNTRVSSQAPRTAAGVTILELMVAVSLITFIILSLYQMFDRTQSLMRGAVRESDKFENGRAAMDILKRDLSQLGYIKSIYAANVGAVTNWYSPSLPPTTYSAANVYQPGSMVASAGVPYIALAPTVNNAPPNSPWVWAAPNFRISEFLQAPTAQVMFSVAGNALLTNMLHDLFFIYFDPLIRTTAITSGNIQPGSSYVANGAVTYNAINFASGDPFFGRANVTTYSGAGQAVLVEGGWRAVGYRVATSTNASVPLTTGVGTLYRYELGTLDNDARRVGLAFTNFAATNLAIATNVFQRVAENVVHFRCEAVTASGSPFQLVPGTGSLLMFGTNVPASVQLELGILDAKIAAQAAAIGTTNYLGQQGDSVQMFRQQVTIRLGQQ